MNKFVFSALVAIVGITTFAKPFSNPKPFDQMTPEEKAVRYREAYENRLEKFGGEIVKPDSQKGRIVFVNAQNSVGDAEFTNVIANVTRQFKYNVTWMKDTGDKITPMNATRKRVDIGADLAIFVIDCNECENLSLVAPESGWVIVNAAAVVKGAKNDAFKTGRLRKALLRAYYAVCGAMNSKYPGSLMSVVTKAEDLDRLGEGAPVDVIQRTRDALASRGVTPILKNYYIRACEQGWAPQPTNEYQKAIWDKIHALPTSPITIKPETKKVTD